MGKAFMHGFGGGGSGGLPPIGKSLDACTWKEINKIGEKGKQADYFAIGDTKTITLTTDEVVTLVLIDFNHDKLTRDTTLYAAYTFQLQNCLNSMAKMNATHTTVGGWGSCTMRTEELPAFKLTLPDDLVSVIKTVQKLTSAGNQSASIVETNDDLFLLSEVELFGSVTYSRVGEGSQYSYYSTSNSRIKKVQGVASIWWERSPRADNADNYCSVSATGTAANGNGAAINYGVSPAFCV